MLPCTITKLTLTLKLQRCYFLPLFSSVLIYPPVGLFWLQISHFSFSLQRLLDGIGCHVTQNQTTPSIQKTVLHLFTKRLKNIIYSPCIIILYYEVGMHTIYGKCCFYAVEERSMNFQGILKKMRKLD